MISFKNFITLEPIVEKAVALTPAQLKKPNSKTKESRIDILMNAIINGDQLELVNGKKVIFANNINNITNINNFKKTGKAFDLVDIKGKIYSSSKLAKSTIFGGGSGAGGGTENTAIVESAQCVWLAAMLNINSKNIEDYTDKILKNAFKQTDCGSTKIDDILSISDDWKMSSFLSAQKIIDNGYVTKTMTFHRDSKLMKKIYKIKNEAFKNNNLAKFTDDKWNPGDIWCIDNSINIDKQIDASSVSSLNQSILKLFFDRNVVAISLKKVKKEAKIKEYNIEMPPDIDDHKITNISLESNKGNFWSNKGGFILYDEGKVEIRTNSAMGTHKVEIIAKGSRGGSAGWGIISDAYNLITHKTLPSSKDIINITEDIVKRDQKSIDIMFDMYSDFYPGETYDNFITELDKKDKIFIHSKIGCLYFCSSLMKLSPIDQNRLITKIINYAGSKSEDSSAYIKVSQ